MIQHHPHPLIHIYFPSALISATTNQFVVLTFRKKQPMNGWVILPPFVQVFLLVKATLGYFRAIQVYFDKIARVLILNSTHVTLLHRNKLCACAGVMHALGSGLEK